MVELIRFHNWIIDKNEIMKVEIISEDKKSHGLYESYPHQVVITLKDDSDFRLGHEDLYEARKTIDMFTASLKCYHIGDDFDHYIIKQVYFCRDSLRSFSENIKTLNKKIEILNKKVNKLIKVNDINKD